jgi:ankyrin repeat protein
MMERIQLSFRLTRHRNVHLCDLLLLSKACPDARDGDDDTALHIAARNEWAGLATLLVAHRASSDIINCKNEFAYQLQRNVQLQHSQLAVDCPVN